MNDTSEICIEVNNVPISTSVHDHVNYSLSTNVDSTEGKKKKKHDRFQLWCQSLRRVSCRKFESNRRILE